VLRAFNATMPFVDVTFLGLAHDRSLEAAAIRWVGRLAAMQFDVRDAAVTIGPAGRRRTATSLKLVLVNGEVAVASTAHEDPYVAISDAFRAVRRELLAHH
jgi:ribosome-associated translation inhibitor RaiA